MKFVSKAAAFGAAAALTATGLVAAAGTSADAATVTKTVAYNCDLSAFGVSGAPQITAAYTIPALPATLPQGTAVPAQAISADITIDQTLSGLIPLVGKDGKLSGKVTGGNATGAGKAKFGDQAVDASLTIPPTAPSTTGSTTAHATGTLAGFTASKAGAQAVSLPSIVTATLDNNANGTIPVTCAAASGADLSLGTVNVTAAPAPGLTPAQKKLKADKAKLKKAKKAYKKAHGAKKAKLHKKVVKLQKKVKKDKKAVKAGK